MEYYETIVESMFERTRRLVERLEQRGTTPVRTRPLHRFIGEAVGTRNEVLSVLHLLDKPTPPGTTPPWTRSTRTCGTSSISATGSTRSS
jgi:hypothetical protein